MPVRGRVLGRIFKDNALYIKADSGTGISTILIDCGENVLRGLTVSEIRSVDYLLFTHFHFDHVCGFDSFIRHNFNRTEPPVRIFGPPGTIKYVSNRLNSFEWNLSAAENGNWEITEISPGNIRRVHLSCSDGFSMIQHEEERSSDLPGVIVSQPHFTIEAALLDHKIPVCGYSVTENDHIRFDNEAALANGLTAGPWIKKLKEAHFKGQCPIMINGKEYDSVELAAKYLSVEKGEKLTCLTDFNYGPEPPEVLVNFISGSDFLFCESQYLDEDRHLAEENYHLTPSTAARLAAAGKVKKLKLFHFSRRYNLKTADLFVAQASEHFQQVENALDDKS